MAEHSKLPWRYNKPLENAGLWAAHLYDADGEVVGVLDSETEEGFYANAELIVRAVNGLPELVSLVRDYKQCLVPDLNCPDEVLADIAREQIEKVNKALAAVEGGS